MSQKLESMNLPAHQPQHIIEESKEVREEEKEAPKLI